MAIIVPGVFGDGPWYDALCAAAAESADEVTAFDWGAPKALFFKNFSDAATHATAEQKLADRLDALPPSVTEIDLIGHSAGCGVILGALSRSHRHAAIVILLAPSVSPTYQVDPALAKVDGRIYSFYSDRDTTFLKWRTSNFGGYDGIHTPAAGYCGFTPARDRLDQRKYIPEWAALGNDGGHSGWLAPKFVQAVISPLLRHRNDAR